MSFQKFSRKQYVVPLDTGVIGQLGSFAFDAKTELTHAYLSIFVYGTGGGTERLRLKVYGNPGYASPVYTSDWSNLSSIPDLSSSWLGNLRFDFGRVNLGALTYYVGLEAGNYTRIGDSFYIGFVLDWPEPVNSHTTNGRGAAIRFVGYE